MSKTPEQASPSYGGDETGKKQAGTPAPSPYIISVF
jgi:hypothetical protein